MEWKEKQLAIEAALLYGFQTETAEFPIAALDGEIEVPGTEDELTALWRLEAKAAPEGYLPAKKEGPIFDTDFRKKKGLETLFGTGEFLKDEDYDFLPDKLDVRIILPKEADLSMITAACNIAFRLGMETTAYEGKILADETYQGNAIVFEDAKSAEMAVEQEENAVRLYVRGRGEELEKLSALVCEKFPVVDAWRSWRDVLMDMADDFALRNADGQLAYLSAYEQTEPGAYELYGSP